MADRIELGADTLQVLAEGPWAERRKVAEAVGLDLARVRTTGAPPALRDLVPEGVPFSSRVRLIMIGVLASVSMVAGMSTSLVLVAPGASGGSAGGIAAVSLLLGLVALMVVAILAVALWTGRQRRARVLARAAALELLAALAFVAVDDRGTLANLELPRRRLREARERFALLEARVQALPEELRAAAVMQGDLAVVPGAPTVRAELELVGSRAPVLAEQALGLRGLLEQAESALDDLRRGSLNMTPALDGVAALESDLVRAERKAGMG